MKKEKIERKMLKRKRVIIQDEVTHEVFFGEKYKKSNKSFS
jgi:hypothetical protein